MRYLQAFTLLVAASLAPCEAWAQYGLYGSPGVVNLPAVQSAPISPSWESTLAYDSATAAAFLDPLTQTAATKPARPPGRRTRKRKKASQDPPNVVDEMLSESDPGWPPPWGPDPACQPGGESACGGACGPFGQAVCQADCGVSCVQRTWFASVSGLIMGRDEPNRLWTTYESGNNPNQLPTDTHFDWRGGGEIRFGRYFSCGTWALEATYWTLDPFTSMVRQRHPNGVSTTLDFTDVVWANPSIPGAPVDLFDGAREHRVWRRSEVHNVELNLVRNQIWCSPSGRFDLDWSLGIRYFRLEDDLTFGSRDSGTTDWTSDLTAVGYLEDDVENDLVGVQLGYDLNYCVGKWQLFVVPKVGIYNNHIRHRFSAYRGDGRRFDVAPTTGYASYPVSSTEDVFSFLTEINVGLQWQCTSHLSAQVGYRAAIATGVALSDHQIPPYVVDTPELANIDHNGHLLLHGGFAGLTCEY